MFNPKLCKTMQLTAICKNAFVLCYKLTVSLLLPLKTWITESLKRIPALNSATESSDKAVSLVYAYNTNTQQALLRINIIVVLLFAGFTQVSAAAYGTINRKPLTYAITSKKSTY